MKNKCKFLFVIIVAILMTGCASQINLRNSAMHLQAGIAAEKRGDWETARVQFAQAVVNADLGDGDLHGKAIVNYEYGKALGVRCEYDSAEKYLLRSKSFAELGGEPAYLPLYELALLNEAQGKSIPATIYFSQLIPIMEKEGLRSRYPLGVADAHERYAAALDANGMHADALKQREEAAEIISENPIAKPAGKPTPYGIMCNLG